MSEKALLELQSQRDALKENIQGVNDNIKKLTGRDPEENRRLSTQRRFQLKRTSLGSSSSNNQPPEKRSVPERRKWGSTVQVVSEGRKHLDSGGEEEDEEEQKPAIASSVVATGKPMTIPKRPKVEDKAVNSRNRRMLGMLMGTLRQFKRESQFKTEQESKREEKLIKVEEQVKKEQEDAQNEKKELFQARKDKQDELRKLDFKIDMAELGVQLKSHYDNFKGLIQLKSTPRVFYKPAKHNDVTRKLLEETQKQITESLEHRLMEMEMCTEEDITVARTQSQSSQHSRRESRVSKDVTVIEPAQTKRDLFEEDQDNDIREREADKKDLNKSKDSHRSDNDDSGDDDVVFVEKDSSSKSSNGGKVLNGNARKVSSEKSASADVRLTKTGDVDEDEEYPTNVVNTSKPQDTRRCVVSENASYGISDERVVEFSSRDKKKKEKSRKDSKMNTDDTQDDNDDGVNIYEDMPQNLDLFQPEEDL